MVMKRNLSGLPGFKPEAMIKSLEKPGNEATVPLLPKETL